MIYSYLIPAGGYAANSNIVAHSDSVMGDWAFQYDTLNRLAVAAPALNAPNSPFTFLCRKFSIPIFDKFLPVAFA
jgi:hypothetical protein